MNRPTTRSDAPNRSLTWQNQAACLDEDPELFFPIGSTGLSAAQVRLAKSVCARCPVAGECLEFALSSRQDYGVWGGLTEVERTSLRRRRRRAALKQARRQPAAAAAQPADAELSATPSLAGSAA